MCSWDILEILYKVHKFDQMNQTVAVFFHMIGSLWILRPWSDELQTIFHFIMYLFGRNLKT